MLWEVKAPNIWPNKAPLNSTVESLAGNKVNSLAASTALNIDITWCTSVEIIPILIPVAPIFVKYGYWAAVAASATVFDDVLTEVKPTMQVWRATKSVTGQSDCTHVSFFSTEATTIYLIKR
jgi:hypothetical protein